ncbi:MAG: hypothetical protein SFY69_05985 [Planctomycetota bacterium]|nr:hypothetical protein [Planctomycetota bacterium]
MYRTASASVLVGVSGIALLVVVGSIATSLTECVLFFVPFFIACVPGAASVVRGRTLLTHICAWSYGVGAIAGLILLRMIYPSLPFKPFDGILAGFFSITMTGLLMLGLGTSLFLALEKIAKER